MMLSPTSRGFRNPVRSSDGSRPTSAGPGTAVTPANGSYGSWAAVLDDSAWSGLGDAYGIIIKISNVAPTSADRPALVKIGVDPAGGTSFTSIVTHNDGSGAERGIYCANAGAYAGSSNPGPMAFFFPLRIASGSSIGACAKVDSATVTDIVVEVILLCSPVAGFNPKTCSYIHAFGSDEATITGASVTPGTTSEGNWAAIGGATTFPYWGFEHVVSVEDGTMTTGALDVEVTTGDASNKKPTMVHSQTRTSSSEQVSKDPAFVEMPIPVGDIFYMRAQFSSTLDAGYFGQVLAVGG